MNSCSMCSKIFKSSHIHTLTCVYCKQKSYCSKKCFKEDWDSRHYSECKNYLQAKVPSLERRSPFLSNGVMLTDSDLLLKNVFSNSASSLGNYQDMNWVIDSDFASETRVVRSKDKRLCALRTFTKDFIENSLTASLRWQQKIIHANIQRLYDLAEKEETVKAVMEYTSGGSLENYVREKGRLTEYEAFGLFVQIANALHFLHKEQLVHRNITSASIMLNAEYSVKISNFECCTKLTAKSTISPIAEVSKTEYMSPQRIAKQPYGTKADAWSLGILLYEMLHGVPPFLVLHQHIHRT
eukprot:TRINITY_DN3800_c0_g3_i1.p1 TRINITY_DN3800_c0_g3~~TRINITY_DN3800_c0_g3_i1.p1  ORF type:complete len:297 (-),score=71.62 TRINITY_DN3800_c0_g3_i1:394-1284(-)